MDSSAEQRVTNVALVSEHRQRVRDLRGFGKAHSVPFANTERTQSFVGRIATDEIGEDLDKRFDEFRQNFRFKRSELVVSEPENGEGAIATPWFEYRIMITHDPNEPAEVTWRRQITQFRDPDPLLSPEFAAVFGTVFDTIEFEPPEPIHIEAFIDSVEDREDDSIKLDYDRQSTWCELTTALIPGQLLVESDRIAFVTNEPQLPARLLSAFFEFRTQLTGLECF
ncbi:MAG: hypothetical protein GY903_13380 [Fuerstiella sp.]|nr:hypothetical protein [Fuerstiella sp.]MCP4855477.1 hypothetical protein [Fuerstiella sp.]